jgi:hypothetical protein
MKSTKLKFYRKETIINEYIFFNNVSFKLYIKRELQPK